jgi:hypothetical protein
MPADLDPTTAGTPPLAVQAVTKTYKARGGRRGATLSTTSRSRSRPVPPWLWSAPAAAERAPWPR